MHKMLWPNGFFKFQMFQNSFEYVHIYQNVRHHCWPSDWCFHFVSGRIDDIPESVQSFVHSKKYYIDLGNC